MYGLSTGASQSADGEGKNTGEMGTFQHHFSRGMAPEIGNTVHLRFTGDMVVQL
jgi:hypothetical protein